MTPGVSMDDTSIAYWQKSADKARKEATDNLRLVAEKNIEIADLREQLKAALAEIEKSEEIKQKIFEALVELQRETSAAIEFHPRAWKLIAKRKNFLVVAEDERYFWGVYDIIRTQEMDKQTWTDEDEYNYQVATESQQP